MADRGSTLRTNYGDRPTLPSGQYLNRIGRAINGVQPGYPTGHYPLQFGNLLGTEAGVIIGVATITDNSNTCEVVRGEVQAPCEALDFYSAKFRYFDPSLGIRGTWVERPTTLRLDASAYMNLFTECGVIPRYAPGDTVAAYFDTQRQWCVPIQSPPDYANVWAYHGQQSISVPRASPIWQITPNAAEISLELYTLGVWLPLSPRLILKPTSKLGKVSGSIIIHTTVRHYELLRLRCGTSNLSRAAMAVTRAGMTVQFLAPTYSTGVGVPSIYGGTDGFATITSILDVGGSTSRWRDAPAITLFQSLTGTQFRMEMGRQSDQWAAQIIIWAEVEQTNDAAGDGASVVVSDENLDAEEGEYSDGMLVEANDAGCHSGIVAAGITTDGAFNDTSQDMRCWLLFDDFSASASNPRNIIAEQGKIYGPCTYIGPINVDGDERPGYTCTRGIEEFPAKSVLGIGTTSVGSTEEFELYDWKKRPSGIFVNAEARWNDVDNSTFALVRRAAETFTVNPLECG